MSVGPEARTKARAEDNICTGYLVKRNCNPLLITKPHVQPCVVSLRDQNSLGPTAPLILSNFYGCIPAL